MAFSVNTNITSLQAQNYLRMTSDFQGKTINRVTSGLRIVSSGDDAAGLAIANGFRSDQAVLSQGVRNANDGLSTLQTIDGGMNNISTLLDRARTLATQSASGTFTGDRSVLNSEFQSVLGEIDRQSQAIGLNQGGQFAKALQVFIGGGKGSTAAAAIGNGAIGVDLSKSTVDSQSLGLKGVQAVGNSSVDLGAAAATSVQNIVSNAANKASESVSGYTNFVFSGGGFSDANKVTVSVNLSGVNDPTTLVTAINAAIQNAGNGASSAATAFKNAGISASIVTDSTGKQRLAFSSSNSAFEVAAGDLTSNALLGNISSGATGSNLSTTVTGSGAVNTAGSIGSTGATIRIQGAGLTSPVDIGIAGSLTGANALASLQSQVASNNTLKAAGISLTTASNGSALQFTSSSGQKFSVLAAGDTGNVFGLGTFAYGGANGASIDYSTITGSSVALGTAKSTATIEVSLNGSSSGQTSGSAPATLASAVSAVSSGTSGAGYADTSAANATGTLNLVVDGTNVAVDFSGDTNRGANETVANVAAYINNTVQAALGLSAGTSVVSVSANKLIFTSPSNTASSYISVAGGGAGTIAGQLGISTTITAQTGAAVQASITGTVNASGGLATNGANNKLKLVIDGQSVVVNFANDPNTGATESQANIVKYINSSVRTALGLGSDVSVASASGTFIKLNSVAYGSGSSIGAVDDATDTLASAFGLATASSTNTASGAGSLGGSISVNLAGGTATSAGVTGSALATFDTSSSKIVAGNIDGTAFSIDLNSDTNQGASETLANVASYVNSQLKATLGTSQNLASVVNGRLVIGSGTTGTTSGVTITANAVTAALGLTVDASTNKVVNGTGPTNSDLASRLTAAFDKSTALSAARLQASVAANGNLTIASANGSEFQIAGIGTATSADLGFGNTGVTFRGNVTSIAPLTSPALISGGAQQTAQLGFSGITNAGDAQLVTVSAADSTGTQQSVNITLRNDTTARNARNIDEAVNAINSALQQSNVKALQGIVAVKSEKNGVEGISFTSASQAFTLSISQTPNGTGIQSTGSVSSAIAGTGNTADISSQLGAQNAVSALATAVSVLGSAQAVVGKGQNQLGYAVNLAQSQLTNLAAAESRIRDADLASESANLTKAQILTQAGVAALAQANSAPQQILALLRG